MGCCECHDHKYDPFKTRDFYAMEAYFADIKQWGVYSNYKYTPEPELEGYNNDYPFPPEIDVTSRALQRRLAALRTKFTDHALTTGRALLATSEGASGMLAWAATVAARLAVDHDGWSVAAIDATKPNAGSNAVTLDDQSVRFETAAGSPAPKAMAKAAVAATAKAGGGHVITLRVPPGPVATVRLEALPDETQGGLVGRNKKEMFTLALKLAVLRHGETKPQPLAIGEALPDGDTQNYSNAYLQPSVSTSWISAKKRAKEPQAADYYLR